MFEFDKKIIVPIGGVIGGLVEYNAMKIVSMGNQEWKVKLRLQALIAMKRLV